MPPALTSANKQQYHRPKHFVRSRPLTTALNAAAPPSSEPEFDGGAVVRYGGAVGLQFTSILAAFAAIDLLCDTASVTLPPPAIAVSLWDCISIMKLVCGLVG